MRTVQSSQKRINSGYTLSKCSLSDEFIAQVLKSHSRTRGFYGHTEANLCDEKMDLAYSILGGVNSYRTHGESTETRQSLICDLDQFISKYPQIDTFFFCAKCFLLLSDILRAKSLLDKIVSSTPQSANDWESLRILTASNELIGECQRRASFYDCVSQ